MPLTLPNLLSLYRLAAAPVAVWLALDGRREAFFILIILSLISDLVDGPIARWFNQNSRFGAKLDTWADAATLLAGLLGVVLFEAEAIGGDLIWLSLFLASYALAALASLIRFRRLPAYHLVTSKAAAFLAAVFFVWLYLVGYAPGFFVAVAGLGTLANLESLLVTLRLDRARTDIRSVFSLPRAGGDPK